MNITLICVGTKMPDWVKDGFNEYQKRFRRELSLELKEVSLAHRSKSSTTQQWLEAEKNAILNAHPRNNRLGLLDVGGTTLCTPELSATLEKWMSSGCHWSLVIGGPDGVSNDIVKMADFRWSLSNLTLPHPLVRIIVAEQLYRAWSRLCGHPYHRD